MTREREPIGEDAFIALLQSAGIDTELIVNNRIRNKMGLEPIALVKDSEDGGGGDDDYNNQNNQQPPPNAPSQAPRTQPNYSAGLPLPPPLTPAPTIPKTTPSNVLLMDNDFPPPPPLTLAQPPNQIERPNALDSLFDDIGMDGVVQGRSNQKAPEERVDPKAKSGGVERVKELNKKQVDDARREKRDAKIQEKRKTVRGDESSQEGKGKSKNTLSRTNSAKKKKQVKKESGRFGKSDKSRQKCSDSCEKGRQEGQVGAGTGKGRLYELSSGDESSDTPDGWFSVSDSE